MKLCLRCDEPLDEEKGCVECARTDAKQHEEVTHVRDQRGKTITLSTRIDGDAAEALFDPMFRFH